jgi:hypothetical protein
VSAAAIPDDQRRLLRRGFALEWITLGWNVVGIGVLAGAAIAARSVALAGFALDSLIGIAFVLLAAYLALQSTWVLGSEHDARHSPAGIAWTAITAAVMFALAHGKARAGAVLDNPVLRTEGRVTLIDGVLALAVLLGLVLNAAAGWWWADPVAAYVLVYHAVREARAALTHQ